jgi:hypothetical protein
MRFVDQSSQALTSKSTAPAADRSRHGAERKRYRARRTPLRSQQHDPCAKNIALFRRRRSNSRFKHRPILRRQPDFRSFGNHRDVESRILRVL